MKIICAGFPKTGTKSMANALSQLGYTVHDFEEHLNYNLDNYIDFFEGRVGEEVFKEMYADVDVVVDQPACTLWNIILKQFPDAKVILMVRDSSDAWFRSYVSMLEDYKKNHRPYLYFLLPWLSKTHDKLEKLTAYNMCLSSASLSLHNDNVCSSLWRDQYARHNAAVQAMVPSDQLLVYRVGEGWEPLCQFLGHPVPADQEFPHENKAGGVKTIQKTYKTFSVFQQANKEAANTSLVILLSTAALIGTVLFKRFPQFSCVWK